MKGRMNPIGRMSFDLASFLLTVRRPDRQAAAGVRRRQDRRLRRLMRYAFDFSPHYREVFGRLGFGRDRLPGSADLASLPILTRSEIAANLPDLVSREVELAACPRRGTSGTTGEIFSLPATRLENLIEARLLVQWYRMFGLGLRDLQAKVALTSRVPRGPWLIQRLGFLRREYIRMTDPPEAKVATLRRMQPDALFCYASVLNEICIHLEELQQRLDIPLVFSSSDMLTPDIRRRARERLGARVVDLYGAVEAGPMAWECPAGGYHVASDAVILEIVDDEGRPADRGRVLCTVLWRRAVPLIRYEVGDLAEWADSPCGCGSPFPRIGTLHGRRQDMVRLPDGRWITAATIKDPVAGKPGIRQYQVVQASPTRFVFRIAAGPGFASDVPARIEKDFRRVFGETLKARVTVVPRIEQPPEAKFSTLVTAENLEQIRARGGNVDDYLS